MTEPLLLVDGVAYRTGITEIRREAEIREGRNAGEALSGGLIRDITGTYYHYTMRISTYCMDTAEYDALFEALSAPEERHTVQVPYGQGVLLYEAAVTQVEDALEFSDEENGNVWGELSVRFTAAEPRRIPGTGDGA